MKPISKVRITTALLAMGIMTSFAGAVASSLAWYAYSTTATVAYKGTSVSQSEQLQIGLMVTVTPSEGDPYNIEFSNELVDQYEITYENVNDKTYAWVAPGTGLNSDLISAYCVAMGYASNKISPTTSLKYEDGDDLVLRQHLLSGKPNNLNRAAKANYSVLPMAFRAIRNDAAGNTVYAKNEKVWITDMSAIADGVGDIYRGVRAHLKSNTVNFITNPSATGDGGYTTMGGLLDLDVDGYYDTEGYTEPTEIVYGSYDGDLPTPTLINADTAIDDVNNTGNSAFGTTFSAKHEKRTRVYTDLSSIDFHKSYWKSLKDIKPNVNAKGMLSGGVPVTKTDPTTGIGDLQVTVYLEGWDHNVIDQEIDHKFALGLTFEINRVA